MFISSIKLGYNHKITGKIKIVLRGEGSDDPNKLGYCSIKVNGVERSMKHRGHNVVVLDDSGNFVTSKCFDTGDASKNEGVEMQRFLDGLPNERIVLFATQDTKGMQYYRRGKVTAAHLKAAVFYNI